MTRPGASLHPLFGNLRHDLVAGLSVAIAAIPAGVGVGTILVGSLGPDYSALGALAGLYGALFALLIPPLLGSSPFQFVSPGPTSAGILAGLVAMLTADPLIISIWPDDPVARTSGALALGFLCAALAGVMQMIAGLARLGDIIKLLPQPVIMGIANGVALLILIDQLPHLLGYGGTVPAGSSFRYADLLVSAATLAILILCNRSWPRLPAAALALLFGTMLHTALAAWLPAGSLGAVLGNITGGLPNLAEVPVILELLHTPAFPALLAKLAGAALAIAAITSLHTLLSAATADTVANTRHSTARELIAVGAANVVAPLFGGLPSSGATGRVLLNWRSGGRTRLVHLVAGLILLGTLTGFGAVLGSIPRSVIAVLLAYNAVTSLDDWTRLLASRALRRGQREIWQMVLVNLGMVVLVMVLFVTSGLTVAMSVGILAAFMAFLIRQGRTVVRRSLAGDHVRSNTLRPPAAMEVLRTAGTRMRILELQGALFFGTADRLAEEIEDAATRADTIVLDLRRLNDIDASGVLILRRIDRRLSLNGKELLLAGWPHHHDRRRLAVQLGLDQPEREGRMFDDINAALVMLEDRALGRAGMSEQPAGEIPLSSLDFLHGLDDSQRAVLTARLERRQFAADAAIIREGEEGDALYLLTSGLVSVRKAVGDGRFLTLARFSTGVTFGEMAIIAGEKRSADIVAETPVICYRLSLDAFQDLTRSRPDIATLLMRNLSADLARRLRNTSNALRELEA